MSNQKVSLSEKMSRLKGSFIEQLPERISELKHSLQTLSECAETTNPTLPVLHRHWHSLKGASRIFGFTDLAKISSAAEAQVHPLLDMGNTPIPAAWLEQQRSLIRDLSRHANQLGQHKDNTKRSFQVPYFEMGQVNQQWQEQGSPLVYVCDDETDQVEYLEYQLQCFGYRVRHFTEVGEFEQAVMEQQPDAVVMDVHFPQGKTAGTDTLDRVNQRLGYQLPALVLSGMENFEARLSAYRAGCRSYFTKPVKPLALADALEKLVRKPDTEPYHVLIVDDEPEVAKYHGLILENAGIKVHLVHDPSQVLNVLREFTPDLILIDVYMPVCNGYELAGVIRQVPEFLGISIIYLSSETDPKKQHSAMEVGVEGFITKPVKPEELVSAVRLRSERMRALRGLMTRDSLTGLYNHTTTTEIISAILAHASRDNESLVLAALDLDLFKQVNDNYGHLAGDQVLLALSHMLKNRLRHGDIVGRYGGEEFVILLRNTGTAAAYELLDQLRKEFSGIVFSAGHDTFQCTFSIGLSAYSSYSTLDELMHHADSALYQAKHQGRNRVIIHEAQP